MKKMDLSKIKKPDLSKIKKPDLSQVVPFVPAILLGLAHIVVIIAVILSYKYYNIYPSIFISAIAIVILFLLIIDIILLVGMKHNDKGLKIIASVLAVLVLIGGSIGVYYIHQVNKAVSGVIDGNSNGSETISGMFVSYKREYPTLKDMAGKSIGFLNEGTEGISSIATELLDKNKIDYGSVLYNSYIEMYQALLDDKVDLVVMQSGYRGMFEKDENLGYEKYFDDTYDNYTFEGKITTEGRKNNKKIDTEPFNVLLIGWSRTEWGSTIGLADAIILATVNPQTYTVSMMSIARDSFVPIPCYGGASDKINSGRSTSRACFIETVENFIGKEVDFYMEADYDAIANIVEAIDGIWIYNPVAFELDGIEVPQGYFQADGWQALEFCRERHHMPGGDFDRQQHQKEVILAIARKMVEEGDVSLALRAMQSASEDLSTDLSVNQLTSIFNMILNTKNYTGLDTFDLLDFHTLRITGSGGIMYYSYSMRLPLWVYLIYQGSYDESMNHVEEVMGNFKTIKQDNTFTFAANDPYEREPFTSEEYDSVFMYKPDPMPPYWADLTSMTMSEALSWAASNKVSLSVKNITVDDPKYVASMDGMVVDQSVRYGSLISEYGSGTITVMGTGEIDPDKQVPNFVGKDYTVAVRWANEHGVPFSIDFNTSTDGDAGKVRSQNYQPGTLIENVDTLKLVVKAVVQEIKFNANGHGTAPETITVRTGESAKSFPSMANVTEGNFTYTFNGWFTSSSGGTRVTSSDQITGNATVYAQWTRTCYQHKMSDWTTTSAADCEHAEHQVRKCKNCDYKEERDVGSALSHSWNDGTQVSAATCTSPAVYEYTCGICGKKYQDNYGAALGHLWNDGTKISDATCDSPAIYEYVCQREGCGETYRGEVGEADTTQCAPASDPEADCTNSGGTWTDGACTMP